MIVVLDTNIWVANLFLKSPKGIAARFYIKQEKVRVALPEVIRLEVERHFRQRLMKVVNDLRAGHRELLAMYGSLKPLILPTTDEIEKCVERIFADVLGDEFDNVPFSLDSARDSFLRTIDKRPPSQGSQQFKDGVLWADCLELLKRDDVVLVTEDTAFFESKNDMTLATDLRNETDNYERTLTIYRGLSGFLKDYRSNVTIDQDALERTFWDVNRLRIDTELAKYGFQLGERISFEYDLFLTENPSMLSLEFEIAYRCHDISGADRQDAELILTGDGFYDPQTDQFLDLSSRTTGFRFKRADEIVETPLTVYVRGMTPGANTPYQVRQRLTDM